MKRHTYKVFLLAVLFITVCIGSHQAWAFQGTAGSAFMVMDAAESRTQAFTKEDIREKLKKKFEFDYKPYLSGEKKMDLQIDNKLYRQIYYYITLKYVENVDNAKLIDGVFTEVGKLLKTANIDPAKLSGIPRSGNPLDSIVSAYGDKIDPNVLGLACVRGMLDALNDPHSVILLPEEYKRLQESMAGGNFSGIGVFIMQDSDNYNWLTVSEPVESTPADKAGLKPGDVILAVNGESTKGEPMDLSVARIRGPVGTTVKLTIQRKGVDKPFDVSIQRAFIHVNSVKKAMIADTVGYLKLRIYGSQTGQELEEAMNQLETKGAKAFILDLRNNSGGLIDASEEVCSKFIPKGSTVVTSINRAGHKRVYKARGGQHVDLPLVVLINELSASASEITAGALRDHKRAILIGEKSFGKGSVQELWPINSGADADTAALKLTVALFYSPSGAKINNNGLEPDIKIPLEPKDANINEYDKDLQLQKAVEYIKGKIKT